MSEHVRLSIDQSVARLTLDRPDKRNALTREIIESLHRCVQELQGRDDVRVLVLQATGKVFCAGMDLGEMQQRATSPTAHDDWQRDSEVYCELLTGIFQLPIPTVAAVQGAALAGGMGLVLACDMVIASENAFFMLPEPMRGITAAMVTPFLVHRMGSGPATYLLLSNERMSAEDSRSYGLCHDVVPENALEERVQKLIHSILGGSPAALAITKQHVHRCAASNLIDQVKQSIAVSAEARETDDAREGLAAFLEKRQPNWQPKSDKS